MAEAHLNPAIRPPLLRSNSHRSDVLPDEAIASSGVIAKHEIAHIVLCRHTGPALRVNDDGAPGRIGLNSSVLLMRSFACHADMTCGLKKDNSERDLPSPGSPDPPDVETAVAAVRNPLLPRYLSSHILVSHAARRSSSGVPANFPIASADHSSATHRDCDSTVSLVVDLAASSILHSARTIFVVPLLIASKNLPWRGGQQSA